MRSFTKVYKIFPTKSVGNEIEIINSKLIQAGKFNTKVNSLADLQLSSIWNGNNNNYKLLEMLQHLVSWVQQGEVTHI